MEVFRDVLENFFVYFLHAHHPPVVQSHYHKPLHLVVGVGQLLLQLVMEGVVFEFFIVADGLVEVISLDVKRILLV